MKMDVIFLSSNEWNAETNYEIACRIFEREIKWLRNEESLINGFKKACKISETDLFILIDGDNKVYPELRNIENSVTGPCIFMADNFLGLRYGHGGIKVLSKETNWAKINPHSLDISTQLNLSPRVECLSYHEFEWSEYSRYRTIFKELLKLHLRRENFKANQELLARWLVHEEAKEVFKQVEHFLYEAKFDSFTPRHLELEIKKSFKNLYDFVLLAILGNDKKWVNAFSKNFSYFKKCYVLDTGSRDGSWKLLKARREENLKVSRKYFWGRNFSSFRNECQKRALKAFGLNERILFIHVDFDEEIIEFDVEKLKDEILFSSSKGERFEVIRHEWHGAKTPIPRIFFNREGHWDGPIHETFWYKEEHRNDLNRLSGITLLHHASVEEELVKKSERDLKILKKCARVNPKRYLYFIFESLDKQRNYQRLIDEYNHHKETIHAILDEHYILLILKYTIHAYAFLEREVPEEMMKTMRKRKYRSVYYQLIKALMVSERYNKYCRELLKELKVMKGGEDDPIFISQAYEKNEIIKLEEKLKD